MSKDKSNEENTSDVQSDIVDGDTYEVADGPMGADERREAAQADGGVDAQGDGDGAGGDDAREALQRERDDMEQRWRLAAADYQNLLRRTDQRVGDARRQQTMDIAKSLLPVLDHFDNALGMAADTPGARSVLEGVQIVRGELLKTLEAFGVRRIDAEAGEAFDPNRHEALMRQPSEDIEPDHVVTQFQPGYVIGETTLRPAKVTIAQ